MGYTKHEAVVVTTYDLSRTFREYNPPPDMDAFRASIPEKFRPLVIGPIKTVTNGYLLYAFLWDGSKEGWDCSREGDEIREQFIALFDRMPTSWAHVAYGGDYRAELGVTVEGGTNVEILATNDDDEE